ncbi:hypothetical protein OSB04_013871 [Centaurea solstitialis]|uniref:Treslin n=1 Tax=Centaurea solstitialis TaxID=347529 RepID=A0AA38TX41_9ASTR|nr:hypothetical protein OSB04_013871 [Centaurea solstitialis]
MADAIDFSKTQRIVLLIDLNPLLQSPNPNPNPNYITSIIATSKILLAFPSLSSSLFSFKLFFSSLSPLLSASTLHRLLPNHPSTSLSFNSPSQTLDSISQTLNSISDAQLACSCSSSNCSHTVSSLLQLAHDYDWESDIESVSGKAIRDPMDVRSNLVVLLSPVCRSLKSLADLCVLMFRDCFSGVSDVFSGKDIHFCWIDIDSHGEKVESNESGEEFALVGNEIRKFGWGFCSTDLIVLGSALVSFGLVYPNIVVSSKLLDCQRLEKRMRGQLNLEISDVSSKSRSSSNGQDVDFVNTFLGDRNDGVVKLHVTAVRRYTECENVKERTSDQFLVRSIESGKKEKDGSKNLFADRVLELLAGENCKLFQKHMGYWAMLSLSNSNGDSCTGILKPFTVHSAIISLIDSNHFPVQDAGGANLSVIENVSSQGDCGSQKGASPSGKSVGDGKRRKMKKLNFRDLTWSSFYKAAYESLDLDLAEVYFANGFKRSKKLKFLKCWMKEVKNKGLFYNSIPDGSSQAATDSNKQKETDINENLAASYQESDEPLSMHTCSNQSRMQEDATFLSKSFFGNLPTKIQQGLESDGVDLKILAVKLVDSSIYWLHQKHSRTENHDESCTIRVSEVIKLLLRDPKDLKQHKDSNTSLQPSNPGSTSEYLVREYPFVILLRMEILQSELAGSIQSSMKVKLVKQICSLLEIIQYLVEGGFHGDISLYDYSTFSLKIKEPIFRYSHKLGDVVDKIYDQMDLLPFGEENEAQALMLNSEDSNQSWREKPDTGASKTIQDSHSADDEFENTNKSEEKRTKEDHTQKLNEARERRERARRFVSFTSRMPDLQRVWAPKQSKIKPPSFVKESKRKKQRRVSYSVVCETPLTVRDEGSKGCSSVSKALFQDDDDR